MMGILTQTNYKQSPDNTRIHLEHEPEDKDSFSKVSPEKSYLFVNVYTFSQFGSYLIGGFQSSGNFDSLITSCWQIVFDNH